MTRHALTSLDSGRSELELSASEKYCLFHRATATFGLLASVVREVASRPPITVVPDADPFLAGICHIRNEFLPVLHLSEFAAREGVPWYRTTDHRRLGREWPVGTAGGPSDRLIAPGSVALFGRRRKPRLVGGRHGVGHLPESSRTSVGCQRTVASGRGCPAS